MQEVARRIGRAASTISRELRRNAATRSGGFDRRPAIRSNETGAMDFTFSRFSPAVEPRFNFCGADVVEVLEGVGRQGGFPTVIRVDQGSEFVSRDLDLWAYQRGVTLRNTILSLHEHNLYQWPARSELGNQ